MLDGFDFDAPGTTDQCTGRMAALKVYNELRVAVEYFDEAMGRLRDKYLNVALETVLHPPNPDVQQIARGQQAAVAEPVVPEESLTTQAYFERGFQATDPAEKVRLYSQAIRLDPEFLQSVHEPRGYSFRPRRHRGGPRSNLHAAANIPRGRTGDALLRLTVLVTIRVHGVRQLPP